MQRCGSAVGLLPARSPDGLQQPFFFLVGPATSLLLDGPQLADLFVEGDQILAERLKTMELSDLVLRFSKRGWIGKGLRHGFSAHPASEAELGIMTRIVRFGAMAGWFTAAADNGGNRTGPKITQMEELVEEPGSVGLEGREGISHVAFLSERIHPLRIVP